MARRRIYPPEFREQLIDLLRAGRKPADLAAEFSVAVQTIRNWLKQAELDTGKRSDGPSTQEKEEIQRLRREVKQLRTEREILSKAAAWFARETDAVPPKSLRS